MIGDRAFVTDGGIETDLIHRRGADLPDFAAFPLLDTADGRAMLRSYYDDYAAIARASGRSLVARIPHVACESRLGRSTRLLSARP